MVSAVIVLMIDHILERSFGEDHFEKNRKGCFSLYGARIKLQYKKLSPRQQRQKLDASRKCMTIRSSKRYRTIGRYYLITDFNYRDV